MRNWTGAFQIATVYVGTVIGAGFATGKEIVEFFTTFGLYGFFAILISGYLFIILGAKIMMKAIDINASSFEEFNEYLYGKRLSKFMNIFTMIMLLGVCAVMFSGAGALFHEQLGYSKMSGLLITSILAFIVLAAGAKGLFLVNSFVVPALVLYSFILLTKAVPPTGYWELFSNIPKNTGFIRPFLSAFSYAALNLALAQAVLVPVAVEMKDKRTVKLGGYIGGLLLTIVLISSHSTILTLPEYETYSIPMATIVGRVARSIFFIYIFIIYGEIFTTIIGNMYGLERQIKRYVSIKSVWIYGGILLVIYTIGLIEYGTLLAFLYPMFGYFSLMFLIVILLKPPHK